MKLITIVLTLSLLLLTEPIQAVTPQQKAQFSKAMKAKDWSKALNLANDLVKAFPQSSKAHHLLASALGLKMQQVSKARAMFSLGEYKAALAKSIELDSNNLDARSEQIGFYYIAPGIAGGDKAYAIEKTQALKSIDRFSGLSMEAFMAAVEKDTEKQQQFVQEMLELKPNNANALMQMALLKNEFKQYEEADKLLQRIDASEDDGWPLMAQYQRAKWRIMANQETAVAIELLNNYRTKLVGIETDLNLPNEAAALWRLALAYEQQNNIEKAKQHLKQSVLLDKNFEEAAQDLKRLSN